MVSGLFHQKTEAEIIKCKYIKYTFTAGSREALILFLAACVVLAPAEEQFQHPPSPSKPVPSLPQPSQPSHDAVHSEGVHLNGQHPEPI